MAKELSCPSAPPDLAGATVLGIVEPSLNGPRTAYVAGTVPVSKEVLEAAGDIPPTSLFRFAAPCATQSCTHFENGICKLGARIAESLDAVVDHLPNCAIRPTCRWHAQEGAAACHRCPQVVTRLENPSEHMRAVAKAQT